MLHPDQVKHSVKTLIHRGYPEGKIAQQTEKINTLNESVAESDKAVREASEQRAADHLENTQTVKDAKAAQQAVTSALTVLKEFYAKASQATALVQKASDDAPATWDSSYKGNLRTMSLIISSHVGNISLISLSCEFLYWSLI